MNRKIIQISAIAASEATDVVYALCDDGTTWYLMNNAGVRWIRMPDIPQPEPLAEYE